MTALPKVIIILALWFLYTVVLYWLFPGPLCLGCGAEEAAVGAVVPPDTAVTEVPVRRYPIDFRWSDATAFTNEGYEAYRAELMDGMEPDNTLEITGLYFEEEPAPEGYENMGFARADQLRQLLDIPEDRVELKARLLDDRPGVREGYFEGVLAEWVAPEEDIAETVEELPDRVNIRFPYNSTQKEYDPEVEEYLRQLSENLQQSGRKVRLTGHADNSGSTEYNQELGLRRAREIRDVLMEYGVPDAQIEVESRGETQPVASNETAEGRHENRRVEIRVLDN